MNSRMFVVATIGSLAPAFATLADPVEVIDSSLAEWEEEVGEFATINFTGFANGTPIDNQYVNLGVVFSGNAFAFGPSPAFMDDWALNGGDEIHIEFEQPQTAIAAHFSGAIAFQLLNDNEIIYATDHFDEFQEEPGEDFGFAGLVSEVSFDEAFVYRTISQDVELPTGVSIDNLYFNNPIPAPSTLACLAAGLLVRRRRRESRRGAKTMIS